MLVPYGPDTEGAYIKDNVGILFHAFHTTRESRRETQPHTTASGAVVTWDGRLDNRAELIPRLRNVLTIDSTDASIVAAAYEEWRRDCFGKLIGDWALSIWDAKARSLILAKDPIGTRHLYYSFDNNQVTWSTILDPLVLFAGRSFALNEEYIAGWLSFFPAAHLTPYVGIHSVSPSCFVLVAPGRHSVRNYWDFDPSKRIRYRTDGEYEEHFRTVFAESVQRRLRSDSPILAELSGGMDSSSIVCMADHLIARGATETPRLDTISYYDDSEPNLNERPYFTKVEEQRGRTGRHIDFGNREFFRRETEIDGLTLVPGASCRPDRLAGEFTDCLTSQGNRVVLSGIGGDEVTGGVPTPTPEIQDLIATASFRALARQLKVWALNQRKPWFHLFLDAAREFLPAALLGVPKDKRPAPWLNPAFVSRHRAALHGYESRVDLFGAPPSFQENLVALDRLRRQIEGCVLPSEPTYEKRYPYLDRGLLEFLYAIPRQQVVRPGQRRSLMRRALLGIVPEEVLNRKRKAYAARAPLAAISSEWASIAEISQYMVSASLGVVNQQSFLQFLQKARHGQPVPLVPLMRTLCLECWLRNLSQGELQPAIDPITAASVKFLTPVSISAEENSVERR